MIQLNIAKGSRDRQYNVVHIPGCVLEQEELFCASHMMLG
jgi:hypothetical protein